jgi:putative FmdB family regulatory protein
MPIYEYECGKCGVFEQSQRISDPALSKCPTCRRKVRRLISNTSFQLKGSGWYVTDYARANGSKSGGGDGKTESAPASDSKSESTTKTDSGAKAATSGSGTTATTAS